MRIWHYNALQRPADEQVSVLYLPYKSVTNSPTPEQWKAWLAWAENPNHEPNIGCTRPPASSPTALPTPISQIHPEIVEFLSQSNPSPGNWALIPADPSRDDIFLLLPGCIFVLRSSTAHQPMIVLQRSEIATLAGHAC